MAYHTEFTQHINAPVTYAEEEFWNLFTSENQWTKNTNITKSNSSEIQRTIEDNGSVVKQILKRSPDQRVITIENQGDIVGPEAYEFSQNTKGQTFITYKSGAKYKNGINFPAPLNGQNNLKQLNSELRHRYKQRQGHSCCGCSNCSGCCGKNHHAKK